MNMDCSPSPDSISTLYLHIINIYETLHLRLIDIAYTLYMPFK